MNFNVNGVLAALRREEREEQKRQRELVRRAKDQAKLSALEQARLEVETYENRLEVLLSVHKQQSESWYWPAMAASLSPLPPQRNSHHEFRLRQQLEVWGGKLLLGIGHFPLAGSPQQGKTAAIERARLLDEQEFGDALRAYTEKKSDWEKMRNLARRILAGEREAYLEALTELSPFSEISNVVGSSIGFSFHSAKLLVGELKVNGPQAIPSETKSLTTMGKVSVKSMPKARFHELYKNYVCACMLRVAREVFALLPVETFLLTSVVKTLNTRTGQMIEQPVLSAAIPRVVIAQLDFDRIDPSGAMENFLHRGDFKVSRRIDTSEPATPALRSIMQIVEGTRAEIFESIIPLTPADLPPASLERTDFCDLLTRTRHFRDELRAETENLKPQPTAATIN